MVWILNQANKPVQVALGGAGMLAAHNTYLTLDDAKAAQKKLCAHETKLGHSGTRRIFCADCGKPFN